MCHIARIHQQRDDLPVRTEISKASTCQMHSDEHTRLLSVRHHTRAVPARPHVPTAMETYAGCLGVHPTSEVFSDSKLSPSARERHQKEFLKSCRAPRKVSGGNSLLVQAPSH